MIPRLSLIENHFSSRHALGTEQPVARPAIPDGSDPRCSVGDNFRNLRLIHRRDADATRRAGYEFD